MEVINKKIKNKNHRTTPEYEKSGIYQINCAECNKYYIGQTSRSFNCRYKEHLQAFKSKNRTSMKSNVAEHMLVEKHNFTNINDDMKILDYGPKGFKLDTKEEFQIYKNYNKDPVNMLNTMQTKNHNPINEKILNLKSTCQ